MNRPQNQPVSHVAGRWQQPWYFESSREETEEETSVDEWDFTTEKEKKKRLPGKKSGFAFLLCLLRHHEPCSCSINIIQVELKDLYQPEQSKDRTQISIKDVRLQGKDKKAEESCPNTLDFGSTFLSTDIEDELARMFPETGRQRIVETKSWKEDRWGALSRGIGVTPKDKTNGPQARTFWLETILASICC